MARVEVFSDGTPAAPSTVEFPIDDVPLSEWEYVYGRREKPRKVDPFVSAAAKDRGERGAPWRIAGEREVRESNEKAKPEIFKKRMFGLARQSCVGLEKTYGTHFDISDLASLLTDGYKAKERARRADEAARMERTSVQESLRSLESDLAKIQSKISSISSEITSSETTISEKQQQATEAASAKSSKKKPKKDDKPPESDQGPTIEQLQTKIQLLERERSTLERDLSPIQSQVQRLQSELATLDAKRADGDQDEENLRMVQLYDAALKFDLERLRQLLSLRDTRPFDKTLTGLWGSPKPKK